jgi:hypothetical protein
MNLVIFGGYRKSLLRVIDSEKMMVIGDAYGTAIGGIVSLSICERPDQVVLSVNGQNPSYSFGKSDILDITGLVKNYCTTFKPSKNHFIPQKPKPDLESSLISQNHKLLKDNHQLRTQLDEYKRLVEGNKEASKSAKDYEFKIRELSHQLVKANKNNEELQRVKDY